MFSTIALSLLLAAQAHAQSTLTGGYKPVPIDKWGGLNLSYDSTQIGYDCQECQNFLTENGYLEKRPGNVLLTTILPGFPVSYVNEWPAPNGTRYLVAQASSTIYQTNFSGSPVAIATTSVGYNLTTVPAFSKLYFADGSSPLWYWDDTSTGTVKDVLTGKVAPVCTYVATKDTRLWCANIPDESASEVRVSSYGGAGYWQVPYNVSQIADAPNQFYVNQDDGDYITCLADTPWGMFVGKKNSTYIIKGTDNTSYVPRSIDPRIGCVDNRSVKMVYGVLHWLGQDGVYGWAGGGPPQILTRELDPLFKQVRQSSYSEGQWATQLQPDWATGTESPTTKNMPPLPWDYTTVPGQIFPSSFTLHDDNRSAQQIGQVGFASDTLVNIDTTSVPLSVGYAQLAPSTSGVQVWISSFPSGNYTTTPTTWTVSGGGINAYPGVSYSNSIYGYAAGPGDNTLFTTAPSSGSVPSINGWNYGAWAFKWLPVLQDASNFPSVTYTWGRCAVSAPRNCVIYDFVSSAPRYGGSFTGNAYSVTINQTGSCSATCPYSISLNRIIAGASTSLSAGTFSLPYTSTKPGYNQVTITRLPGGAMSVYLNGALMASALDNSPSASFASVSNLDSVNDEYVAPPANLDAFNIISTMTLSGYGTGSIVSRVFDTGQTVPLAGAVNSSYTLTTDGTTSLTFKVRASTSPNNDQWTGWTTYTNSQRAAALDGRRYHQFEADFATTVASETPTLGSFQIIDISTGYYYSKVNYLGTQITAWKQFAVTESNPGTYGYSVRQATYSFPASNTNITWVAQTANQNVNLPVLTTTYAQFRFDSTSLANADNAEPISGTFLRWSQGTNIPVAAETLDRRYLLCVTVSTSVTTPDTCLLRQKSGKWIPWKGPTVGAFGIFDYNIVAADGASSSKAWKIMQPGVFNDDGAPIDAVWVGADITDGLPFNDKTLYEFWVDAAAVAASSVTISYSIDKSASWVDKTISLDAPGAPPSSSWPLLIPQTAKVNKWISLLAGSVNGRYIRYKIEDPNLNSYSRINGMLLYLMDQNRRTP